MAGFMRAQDGRPEEILVDSKICGASFFRTSCWFQSSFPIRST